MSNGSYRREDSVVYRHGKRIEVTRIIPPEATPRRWRKDTFVQVPLAVAAAITKATKTPRAMVALMVLYEAWANKGKPFILSNKKLAGYGVTPDTKNRALADLDRAGLITIRRKGKGAATVTWITPNAA
jgi:hypothetical protein